jgi:hypothetical protein
MRIPFHIVLEAARVMAEPLQSNGGKIELVEIAGI